MFNIPTRDTDKVFNLDFCVKLAILHKNLHLLRHYCRNNTQLYEESILKLGAKYDSFNNNLVECVEYVLAGNSLLDDTGENKIHLGVQIAKGQTGKGFLYILSRKYTGLTFKEIIDVACNYGKFKLLREYMHKYASQNGSSTGLADYINQSKLEYYVKNNQKQKIIKLTQKIRKISKINGLSMCTDCEIIEWFYKYRPSALGIFALNLCSFEYCEPSLRYTPQINGCVIGQNPQYVYLFIKSGKVIKKMTDDKRYKTHPINRDFLSLLSK